ncbi:MAG: GHKL domain-containing protein [Gammaproteobacteria bacterium]|nr:GHKL domain-containing protein [Gammaproteobacteria bacterium]
MSLNRRIILSATLVLIIFITLTAVTLERAFIDSSESALRDTLTSQLYALMAVAEVENNNIIMPSNQLDALLGLPASGIYAYITNSAEQILWQSSSALGAKPPQPTTLTSGDKYFNKISVNNNDYYTFAYGVDWASETSSTALTFNIATDLKSFDKKISEYRKTLWGWLVAMAMLLLISQALILRWGLSPLRKVGFELNRIESGEQEQIQEQYPLEIERLTNNINILLERERQQKTRYRNALGDLAHSLKTPLAVMQSGLSGLKDKADDSMQEQIRRMNSIVEYQLQRAATAGAASLGKAVNVKSITNRILESLHKVYQDKQIRVNIAVDEKLLFKGDEGDLMEVLGNLLDNAFKWTNQQIEIKAHSADNQLRITVNDDGPGIAQDKVDELLQRGVRADQTTAGHGIGLSIVKNIVQAYHGSLKIEKSRLGGAEVSVVL